jgi:hypothetical protein
MSVTKIPTDIVISDMERQCMMTNDERQRRQFLACKACALLYNLNVAFIMIVLPQRV